MALHLSVPPNVRTDHLHTVEAADTEIEDTILYLMELHKRRRELAEAEKNPS